MKVPIYLSAVLLLTVLLATSRGALFTEGNGVHSSSCARRPELEYLKAVNAVAPARDPQTPAQDPPTGLSFSATMVSAGS